jgi:hypothetical protein
VSDAKYLRDALLERRPGRRRRRGIPLAVWFVLFLLVAGGAAAAILFAAGGTGEPPEASGVLSGENDVAAPESGAALSREDLGLGDDDTQAAQAPGNPARDESDPAIALADSRDASGSAEPARTEDRSTVPARGSSASGTTPSAGSGDGARDLVEDALAEATAPAARAEILYRLGLIARYQKRESDAQTRWTDAYNSAPGSVGGRLAAVALADTAFARSVVPDPSDEQYARWELIRDTYSNALGRDGAPFLTTETRGRIVRNLHILNDRLIFSPAPVSGAVYHTVEGGEYLSRIAGHYGVHYLAIAVVNRIDPNRVRVGRTLKILKGTCEIVVDRSDLTLTWYLDGRFVRQVPCCIGPGEKTPTGTYTIINQEEKPAWPDPETGEIYPYGHPENILGTHWLGLEGGDTSGLGIHGTTVPNSIPGRTSAGCVRLHNDHVRELYGFARLGTTVVIRD